MKIEVKIKIVGYEPSPGHTASQEQAKRYGPELLRIERERGSLDNVTILAEAKRKSSPLHDWFTWDDGEAAEKWRHNEAKTLRQAVHVRIRYPDGHEIVGPITIALHVHVEGGKGNREPQRVLSLVRVLQSREDTEDMVADALSAYVALRDRWKILDEAAGHPLAGIHREIDAAQQKLALDRAEAEAPTSPIASRSGGS